MGKWLDATAPTHVAQLAAGIVAIIISTAWFLHIIVYMITSVPLDPFLNTYLQVCGPLAACVMGSAHAHRGP